MIQKEPIVQFLKVQIDQKGVGFLNTNSYSVYQQLLENQITDPRTARLILISLLAGAGKNTIRESASLSEFIQKECFLKKAISDELADLYLTLFSSDHCREWEEKTEEGFREFCQAEWTLELKGYAVWHSYGTYMDASCHAEVEVQAGEEETLRKAIEKELKNNPFLTAEAICLRFEAKLQEELDDDFTEYVECEDYYPPVVEDYEDNLQDLLLEFCRKNGLRLISFDYEGDLSDVYFD